MKTKLLVTTLLIVIIIIGCKSPQPMLSNLHHNVMKNGVAKNDVIDVKVKIEPFKGTPQQLEEPKLLWDLHDSLPYHLLKIVAAKTEKAEDVIALMSKPIKAKKDDPPSSLPTDYTSYKVRISFTNIKRYLIDSLYTHPNTRMAYLNTYLTIPANEDGIVFQSINKLENEFDEVDLGNITRSKSVTFNSKLSATGQLGSSVDKTNTSSDDSNGSSKNSNEKKVYDAEGNLVGTISNSGDIVNAKKTATTTTSKNGASVNATGELSYQNVEALNEARLVKLKKMRTGFSFDNKEIVISQEGRPNGDISNMVFVDASISFNSQKFTADKNVYAFTDLFNDDFQPKTANEIKFDRRPVSYVQCGKLKNLKLKVAFEGLVRTVENNKKQTGENGLEYDDKVTMNRLEKTSPKDIEIDPFQFCKNVYKVVAVTPQNDTLSLRILWRREEKITLLQDDKPEEFISWLTRMINKNDPKVLSTDKYEMYFKISNTDKIYVIKEKMTAEDMKKLRQLIDLSLVVETN